MPTKIFKNSPRFSPGILLILLIVSILGIFFSLHNNIIKADAKTPILAVMLTIIVIIIALTIYQQFTKQRVELKKANAELKQLKETINSSKEASQDEKNLDDNSDTTTQIDSNQEATNLIPTDKFDGAEKFLEKLLSNIAKKHDIVQAVAFKKSPSTDQFQMVASYAYFSETDPPTFTEGVSLPGQVAKNKAVLNLTEVPADYTTVLSGLGKGAPSHLLIIPILNRDQRCSGVIELSSFSAFDESQVTIFETLGIILGEHIKTIGKSIKE